MDKEQMESLLPAFREIGDVMLTDIETDILSMEWQDEKFRLIFSVRIIRLGE